MGKRSDPLSQRVLSTRERGTASPPSPPARRWSSPATAHYGAASPYIQEHDATTEYAATRREHGRFGSHPSHDDYGEAGRA